MRKENSKFNTAFVSHEGGKLFNNDYYGSAELEGFACYVVADGIEDGDVESQSAVIAVQAAIAAFHEHPSIKPWALRHYVRAAHRALCENTAHQSLRAAITVVVTDYQALRFAWAGNTRFYLYRSGRILTESRDHSLSRQLADKGQLPLDKIALHEERGNLSRYLGQPGGLNPQISKKIKLKDGDAAVLITRGLWEHCDSGDIRAALDSAENDPQKAVEGLERLMLDRRPEDPDNYSATAVFIDKVFTDPNRSKKLKRILTIAIPVFVVVAVLAVVLIVQHNKKETKRQNMQTSFLNAVEYIADENYQRAGDEIKTATTLAAELKDREFQEKAANYQKLTESVVNGDTLLFSGAYEDAQAAYLAAQDRSRYTDNAGQAYIARKLSAVGGYISVRDLIALGDTLAASGDYSNAENKYMAARQLASGINDADGRKQAIDALQSLYEQSDRDDAQTREAAKQQSETLQNATDMETTGDEAAAEGNLAGAKLCYTIARERFAALNDEGAQKRLDDKLTALAAMQAQKDEQARAAAQYVEEGNRLYDEGNFVDAKIKYIFARNIYSRIQDDILLADVLAKVEICDSRIKNQPETPVSGESENVTPTDIAPETQNTPDPALPGATETPPPPVSASPSGENNSDSDAGKVAVG